MPAPDAPSILMCGTLLGEPGIYREIRDGTYGWGEAEFLKHLRGLAGPP